MIKSAISTMAITILVWSCMTLTMAMGLDAYEYERTGSCQGCFVLQHINTRIK